MLTPHSTEKSLVLSTGYNLLQGWPKPIEEEEPEVEYPVEHLIKESEKVVEESQQMRTSMLTVKDRLHTVLETLINSEIDIAAIIGGRPQDV